MTNEELQGLRDKIDDVGIPQCMHAGRTVGRTLYVGDGPDDLIGIVDTREQAEYIVAACNAFIDLVLEVTMLKEELRYWQGDAPKEDYECVICPTLRGNLGSDANRHQCRNARGWLDPREVWD